MAISILRCHRACQLELRLVAGPDWRDENLVFPDAHGRAQRGKHVLQRHFTPLLTRAGLPLIRFHDLRHTAATLLLHQGINPKVVSEMLGHSNITMTLETYSHVLPDMQESATTALD